ncbi:MAG: hypothetical protein HY828_15435 [Actinobacteria bacterium]|nr:hypothetical protein [Actinomycetota bacterium]
MNNEPAVLPPPTGGPTATLPPPRPPVAAAPGVPFLPSAPSRPTAPRPAVDVSALRLPTAPTDAAPLPAWKQQRKGSSLGRAVKWFVVACVVCGLAGGVFALVNQPDDGDLPVAELQSGDPGARLPGQQAIDDARAVVGQSNGDLPTSRVNIDGRLRFITDVATLPMPEIAALSRPGATVNGYQLPGGRVIMAVLTSSVGFTGTPDEMASAMAAGAASESGAYITGSSQLPVNAGVAYQYELALDSELGRVRILVADNTVFMILGSWSGDGTEPPEFDDIWRSVTFDGVSIV